MNAQSSSPASQGKGKVVRTLSKGLPILWTLVPELPDQAGRLATPWLVIISWTYDGSVAGGMPSEEVNQGMLGLADTLGKIERPAFCHEAYRRVGCGLREFVFYVSDRNQFMLELNDLLAEHPRYPIEIKFFEDPEWSELKQLIGDLKLG